MHYLKTKQQGFSLIEVLVSILIMAIGLLGMASLQVNSARYQVIAQSRAIAAQYAGEIVEKMQANPTGAQAGAYKLAKGAVPGTDICPTSGKCEKEQRANSDLTVWRDVVTKALPGGDTEITYDATKNEQYAVTVYWYEVTTGNTQSFILNIRT